jgi:hypothetical protein
MIQIQHFLNKGVGVCFFSINKLSISYTFLGDYY